MSENEFARLVEEFYEPLYRFALSLARSEDGAWDLTQQTFSVWGEKGPQLRDQGKAKSWLFTTLYRAFLAEKRHSSRYADSETASTFLETAPAEVSALEPLDGSLVMEALGDLDESYRAPLALFYIDDLSYKEIAEILGIPIGTVMSRLSRGKEMLRNNLQVRASYEQNKIIPMSPTERGASPK